MSRDFNRVVLLGRLTREPDVRCTPQKQKVASFSLATGRQWKNKATGEQQSHTDFIQVVGWGFTADILEKYCHKGSQVLIEGRLSTRDYDDVKTGQHKWVTEVVADSVILLGSPRKDGEQGTGQPTGQYPQQPNAGSLRGEAGIDDDFPLDFSELGGASGTDQAPDANIPF